MRSIRAGLAALGLVALIIASMPARADGDGRGGRAWGQRDGASRFQSYHDWRDHDWREQYDGQYGTPPVTYDDPDPGYYAPPVTYDDPGSGYDAPPPGVYYVLPPSPPSCPPCGSPDAP